MVKAVVRESEQPGLSCCRSGLDLVSFLSMVSCALIEKLPSSIKKVAVLRMEETKKERKKERSLGEMRLW